jgi:AraC-like DNA-binding protein
MAWSTKLWMAEEMIRDPNRLHDFSVNFFPPTSIALSLRLLSMIGYTSYGLWLVRRFQGNLSGLLQVPPKAAGTVIRFMKYLLWVCLVAEISFFILQLIFLTDRNLTTGYIVSNPLLMLTFIGILSIPVVIQLHPEVLYGIPRWPGGQQFGNGLLSVPAQNELPTQVEKPENERRREKLGESDGRDRFQELAMRTERILAEKKPYLDPDFSLDDLARLMDVPKHHLYYCFNHILQKKFTQLRAEYRVRHALSLIEGGHTREKTLEAIGLESGFSSRSSFITAFREVTGKLPSEYQQSLAASHPQRSLLQIPLNPVNTASD